MVVFSKKKTEDEIIKMIIDEKTGLCWQKPWVVLEIMFSHMMFKPILKRNIVMLEILRDHENFGRINDTFIS